VYLLYTRASYIILLFIQVDIDEREVGKHVQIRVFRKVEFDKMEEVEALSIKPGKEYILYSHADQNVRAEKKAQLWWLGEWTTQKNYNVDPHGCLKKDQQCKLCPFVPSKDGWKVGKNNLEPHRSLSKEEKCTMCEFKNSSVAENLESLAI
jgi:hypothetical protein